MVALYSVVTPAAVAVARAMRDPQDAATLRRWITRRDLGGGKFARLFERTCYFYAGGGGREPELLAALARARSSGLHEMACQLAQLPDGLIGAVPIAEIAAAVIRGPRAFVAPHTAARRRTAA